MNRDDAKFMGVGGLGCLGLVVLAVALTIGAWFVRVHFAETIGRGNARIQLQGANYRIPAYDHFFNLCASVQNAEAGLDAQMAMSASDRKEYNIAALQATRARGINQYNADAAKDYTLGQFRDSGLPYHLDPTEYTGENKTQCAS